MQLSRCIGSVGAAIVCSIGTAAVAQAATPREMLVQAAFLDRDRATALRRVELALQTASAAAERTPQDQEAAIVKATAFGYHAKLTGSRSEAITARKSFEALATRYPRDPEAQAALGAWHVGVIFKVGRILGGAVAGASKSAGFNALDRSVALGGDRAMFLALNGLLRLELDTNDSKAQGLLERAARAPTPTAIDSFLRRAAAAVLAPLRRDDDKSIKQLAKKLLPFGQLPEKD